ncbi:divalent metal cation transporter [Candidatus Falkowbacteria bacterium]|uniref:Iron transporter n=1 Tax=Candidatus Falkowbacteria bacterium CG10_big_fil_rev_8_21_14_0_10_37_18 TaxID=1974562 RepID=A0A2H0V9X0_9BACT|nr:divalent metal cation transporter [Candidatus Falkowbacteria bacterium]NCQ12783.1 divalent metal cation transporter [Candidatus Falkowbacteria bacterium]OIO06528.1 MAG: iron transporter [Candidatus Falkowbacteria bacterium CG1_02_37_21]PIR95875.1 MAG: iron transporter [Candidatus Falkowbacteria bacterium CG10_big_fil_rev_8_21_14_0_10_37_18]
MSKLIKKIKKIFKTFGPGIITGAADDDPSGIATYTQTGAQFGYGQLWIVIFMLPLMTAIQEACARIGAVTGRGLTAVIKENYNQKILYGAVMLVVVANTINIGADIGAVAAAARLIIPLNFAVLAVGFTALILILEIFTSYKFYSRILKWLALALLAYPLTVFFINHPWKEIFISTIWPHIELNFEFFFIITGVLGTTISPYMFFWQASQEVEEEKEKHLIRRDGSTKIGKSFIKNLRLDNFAGMLMSEVATWSIIVVAATVLHGNGITNVATAADAAKALEPLVQTFPYSGFLSKLIFSTGIIGLGLLAIPVLAGSAAYAFTEAFNMKEGLNLKIKKAHGFYGVIIVATLVGLFINFIGINPIQALVFTAVFNGVAAVPLIFLIAKIANNKKIMGEYSSGWLSNIFVWITFFVMLAAALAMFYTLGRS